jgi:hypothetical protein
MAELFGTVTAAIGLIRAVDALMNLGGTLTEYVSAFRDEAEEHKRLRVEVKSLQFILKVVREKFESAK